jgi:hypothetical protein
MIGLEGILQRELEEIGQIAREVEDPGEALAAIVRHHLAFTLEAGDRLADWKQEFRNLPAEGSSCRRARHPGPSAVRGGSPERPALRGGRRGALQHGRGRPPSPSLVIPC